MDDHQLLSLYLARCEDAVSQTEQKYSRYCHSIAYGILGDVDAASECVNDALLAAWTTIPPHRPENLRTYLAKLTRNTALKRFRFNHTAKRGGSQLTLALEELSEDIPSSFQTEAQAVSHELTEALNSFLSSLPKNTRQIFLRRYWFLDPITIIASDLGFSVSKTSSILHRTRLKLHDYLSKEGLL